MDLQTIHGHTRWLVVGAVVIAAVWMLYGALSKRSYDRTAYRIMTAFSSIIGLQWALGLIVFIMVGLQGGFRWEHALTNTIALAVAHGHFSMKKQVSDSSPQPKLYWRALLIIGLTMAIIFVGVARLPYDAWTP